MGDGTGGCRPVRPTRGPTLVLSGRTLWTSCPVLATIKKWVVLRAPGGRGGGRLKVESDTN